MINNTFVLYFLPNPMLEQAVDVFQVLTITRLWGLRLITAGAGENGLPPTP